MKNKIKNAAKMFFTVFFALQLSACASILNYWSFDDEGGQVSVQEQAPPAQTGADSGQDGLADEAKEEVPEKDAAQTGALPKETVPSGAGEQAAAPPPGSQKDGAEKTPETIAGTRENPAALAEAAAPPESLSQTGAEAAAADSSEEVKTIAALRREAAEAAAAQKKAEDELAEAKKRIAALESYARAGESSSAAALELEEAQKKLAEAQALNQKTAAELAAAVDAQKKAAEEAAAQKKAAELAAAAQKKAVEEAAAAQKKAEQELAEAKKRIAGLEEEAAQNPQKIPVSQTVYNSLEAPASAAVDFERPGTNLTGIVPAAASPQPAVETLAVVNTDGSTDAVSKAQNAKYVTVGTWPPDCFWRIAELVYGDPNLWPVLYEANRSKLKDPEDPNIIDRGVVLEIPSINGEKREGNYSRE
ncbi:MAG: hypothetical protein LBC53_00850 [Spirochaetaceae bacterium]|jgi:hypothetical protein|nr:hypothetical protein [Spirochaetaceae bacterium]